MVYLASGNDALSFTRQADPYSRIGWDGTSFTVLDGRGAHPVTSVLWFGAVAYCNWLSVREGRAPCYDTATWAGDFTKRKRSRKRKFLLLLARQRRRETLTAKTP